MKPPTTFRDLPLHKKLRYALLATSGTALILAFLALGIGVAFKLRAVTDNQLTTLVRAVALNMQAAVAFGDQTGGENTLSALRAHKDIDYACVIRVDGARFVDYTIRPAREERCKTHPQPAGWFARRITIVEPIVLEREPIGTLIVVADISDTWRDLLLFLAALALLSAGALMTAVLIGRRFHPFLTDPILKLASTAERISRDKNYALRAEKNGEDEVGRLIDSFNDMVNEVEKRDDQLARHRRDLERQVAERTAELRESLQAAEAASRAKSQFLATMSHEIRTPMNGVLGMTELLLDSDLSGNQRRYGETIRQSGEALLTIINDILDFSKIEAGRMELESIAYNPSHLLYDVAEMLGQHASAKGLEVVCAPDPATPQWVRGDPNRVRQILTNLVGNAIKFTQHGEILLSLEPVPAGEDGEAMIRFSVRDSGIGIEPEALGKLFQAFSQADNSHARRFGGTGLGLAIARQLCHLMGGEIEARSTPGVGSAFAFTLRAPLAEGAPVHPERVALRGVRVLAVDDNPTNLEILCGQLRNRGMLCDPLDDPEQAIGELRRALPASPYRVALIDMNMPVMTGLDLARAIRADADLDGTALILLTSQSQEGELGQARAAGFSAVIHKPARAEELADAIERTLCIAEPGVVKAGAAVAEEQLNLGGAHVLLAEDNPVNQSLAIAHLHRLGCQVTLANNGLEALDACQRERFDVILMDCQMPEMDGYEATRRIRAEEPPGRRTPIIAVTANAMRGDRDICLACGMDDFLAKPYKQNEMRAMLNHWASAASAPMSEPVGVPHIDVADTMEPVLDTGVLADLSEQLGEDNPGLISQLVATFLENSPELLMNMETAFEAGDGKELTRAAHTLKSVSASLGALRLSALSKSIEQSARAGNLDGLGHAVAQARSEYRAAESAFRARFD